MRNLRFACWLILLAGTLVVCCLDGASAEVSQDAQQACTPDAMRLCGEFVPNVDAITACMIQKKAQLSPQCRVFFRNGPEPGDAAGQPVNLKPAAKKRTTSKPAATKSTTASKKKPKADET